MIRTPINDRLTHSYDIGGQTVVYNAERKLANTVIEEPFLKAGKMFGFKGAGIGLNYEIVKFILQRKATLMIHVALFGQGYWIPWDKLKENADKNYDYKAGGHKWVKVIPLQEFSPKMEAIPVSN